MLVEKHRADGDGLTAKDVFDAAAPFGGFKNSGPGREAGIDTIYDYTRTKTVWINTSSEPMANPFIMR